MLYFQDEEDAYTPYEYEVYDNTPSENDNFDVYRRAYSFGLGKRDRSLGFGLGKRERGFGFGLGKRERGFGFGLGKRERGFGFGLGKRERGFGFGLGKRERGFGFGLGKRNSNYGFGLGKRSPYHNFGLGKKSTSFGFGLGKRSIDSASSENLDLVKEFADEGVRPSYDEEPSDDVSEHTNETDVPNSRGKREAKFSAGIDGPLANDNSALTFGSFGLGKRGLSDDQESHLHSFGLEKRSANNQFDNTFDNFDLEKKSKSYMFGLGKRSGNLYGFGLGKRYLDEDKRSAKLNFGLGKKSIYDFDEFETNPKDFEKRVRNYEFGLGKRTSENFFKFGKRPAYAMKFGLGKRSLESQDLEEIQSNNNGDFVEFIKRPLLYPISLGRRDYYFGLGKRGIPLSGKRYSFGLGKRSIDSSDLLLNEYNPSIFDTDDILNDKKSMRGYGFGLGKRFSQPFYNSDVSINNDYS